MWPDTLGIGVMSYTMVGTDEYKFEDAPQTTNDVIVDISGNTVDGAYYGIVACEAGESFNGNSSLMTDFVVDVYDNELTNISDTGILAVTFSYVGQSEAYGLESNATLMLDMDADIESNSIGMDGIGAGIVVTPVISDFSDYESTNSTLAVDITDNTVTGGGWYGVYVGDYDIWSYGSYDDVLYENTTVTTISNNVFECEDGVYVENSASTINDNTIVADYYGISGYYADLSATGNSITGSADYWFTSGVSAEYGITEWMNNEISGYCYGADFFGGNATFDSNLVQDCSYGISLRSEYAWVTNNQVIGCTETGITTSMGVLAGVEDAVYEIVGNTIDGNSYGVYITGSDILFADNLVTNSYYDGANFEEVEYCTIENNTFSDNGEIGLYIDEAYEILVANNTFSGNYIGGLYIGGETGMVTLVNGIYSDNLEFGLVAEWWVEWTVDGVSEVRNNYVYLYGALTIVEGGELTLVNVPGFCIESGNIMVEEGGTLISINSEIEFDDWYYLPGKFEVYGVLELDNTEVSDGIELYLGPTSEATIANSWIFYMSANGIHVDDCSPEITNSFISMNDRDGIYVTGANAAPVIMGCFISDNWRGMYVYQASMADVVDNIFYDNEMAGVYLEQVNGTIHDNVFLFNTKEIFVKDCDVSIVDNEIGYGNSASYMLNLMAMSEVYEMMWYEFYLSEPMGPGYGAYWFMDLMNPSHIGIYSEASNVTAMDNVYGLVYTAVYCVDSTLYFSDSVESNQITVPLVTADIFGVSLTNMTFDAQVFDGIKARNSDVTITGAYFDVLDDAVFLDGSTAVISDTVFDADDNDVYLMSGSTAETHDSDLDGVLVDAGSTMMTYKVVSLHVVNEDNRSVEGAEVEIISEDGLVVASGETDEDGDFSAEVLGARYTGDGVEEMDYTLNVTHKSQKVSTPVTDEMTIELPGSGALLDNDTAFLIAIAVAALLAVALVAVAFKKD